MNHTPEPLHFRGFTIYDAHGRVIALIEDTGYAEEQDATVARLVACYNGCADIENPAAAPELLEAVETFSAWLDNEDAGPARNGHKRDTPEGEAIWRAWWDRNLDLCALAQRQARAAIAKAKGETP